MYRKKAIPNIYIFQVKTQKLLLRYLIRTMPPGLDSPQVKTILKESISFAGITSGAV